MKRTSFALAAAAAFGAGAVGAFAKAPKPADLPTVEDIYQQAKTVLDGQKAGPAAAKHDPLSNAITGYRDGTMQLTDFKLLTDCVNNPAAQAGDRNECAHAIVERFMKTDTDHNPENRATRRAVALAVLDLMKADKAKDETGLQVIETILFGLYRQKMIDFKFRAGDKPAARQQAWTKMKLYLGKGEN